MAQRPAVRFASIGWIGPPRLKEAFNRKTVTVPEGLSSNPYGAVARAGHAFNRKLSVQVILCEYLPPSSQGPSPHARWRLDTIDHLDSALHLGVGVAKGGRNSARPLPRQWPVVRLAPSGGAKSADLRRGKRPVRPKAPSRRGSSLYLSETKKLESQSQLLACNQLFERGTRRCCRSPEASGGQTRK